MNKTLLKPTMMLGTIVCVLILASCGGKKEQSMSDKVLEFANRLVKVIDEFEAARTKVLKVIDQSAKNMEKYLSGNLSTKEKADNYEKDWKKLADEIKTMESNFNVIYKSSESYFTQLYSLNESINNDELRMKEKDKNVALRRSWDKIYEQAEEDVKKIRTVLQEGNDFHKVLLASVMRAKISDNIIQMKDISSRARRILKELSRFSIEGKKILRGGFSDYANSTKKTTNKGQSKEQEDSDSVEVVTPKNVGAATLTEVSASNINASSAMSVGGIDYGPSNVTDNNLKTWWSPTRNHLHNNWLQITFDQMQPIRSIEIHGGSHYPNYPNWGDIYRKNYRVKTAELEFSDGSTETINLKDVDAIQEFSFPAHETRFVVLRVKDWYDTEKWEDLCVSHFKVFK